MRELSRSRSPPVQQGGVPGISGRGSALGDVGSPPPAHHMPSGDHDNRSGRVSPLGGARHGTVHLSATTFIKHFSAVRVANLMLPSLTGLWPAPTL
uniref:Uncharacterized protein n=1 Tax=Timema bartmani TaxID=61472 RepID=A0A7R9I8C4_9NEOP|nr:unnamed protein product [Timema bartmani]